jgi:hypothetical protein
LRAGFLRRSSILLLSCRYELESADQRGPLQALRVSAGRKAAVCSIRVCSKLSDMSARRSGWVYLKGAAEGLTRRNNDKFTFKQQQWCIGGRDYPAPD